MTSPSPEVFALPTSFAQELLWHLDRATPGMTAYNTPRARRIAGPLDAEALGQAINALAERHEILRTQYAERDGAVVQMVRSRFRPPLAVTDLSALAGPDAEAEARRLLREEAGTPFDLAHEPPFRCRLLRLGPTDHVLILSSHHIATDGWSGSIMLRELLELYEGFRTGSAATLAPLAIQYGDFAAWQREQMDGPRLDALLAYWRDTLAGPLPVLELPTDRPRPRLPSFEGGAVRLTLGPEAVRGLRAAAERHGASLYMILLAAYQCVLSRWSGQDDIVVGAPVAGRDRPETEGLIGFVANTLVYRTRLGDDPTFDDLIDRVRDTCLGAYDHQDIPLEKLVMDLKAGANLGEASLFRVVCTMLDDTPPAQQTASLRVDAFAGTSDSAKFDLVLFLSDREHTVRLGLNYRADLFDRSTAERFLGHVEALLGAGLRDGATRISRLPLLTAAEVSALAAWNPTGMDLGPATTIASLILAAGQAAGGRIAVVSGETTLTWELLLDRSHRLGHYLQSVGAGPNTPVGLCLDRSTDLLVGMTGILSSGAAYVPLLPELPSARLAAQCAESGIRLAVTDAAHAHLLPEGMVAIRLDTDAARLAAQPATPPVSAATPESLAYLLFTSGSTGTPKGVAVTHRNLVHYTRAICHRLGYGLTGDGERWHFGTVSTLGADLGHTSVFPALCSGGTLHVMPGDVILDGVKFQAYITRRPLDVLKITPSHFRALVGPETAPEHLPTRWLVLGGEACPWDLAEQILARGRCRLLNHYGPTETTVGACARTVARGDGAVRVAATVPIGRPLPNVTAHVLEPSGLAAPVGVPGELYIGGAGVARGYLNREDLTCERFLDRNGERVYRTGDRVRRLESGDIEFLGRFDFQVKIRGNRVELGEIESVMERLPAVRQAVMTFRDEVLAGYVVLGAAADDAALTVHARASLPDYMVPSVWVRLERLPLNSNGKVNRSALVPPAGPERSEADAALRNDTERALAELWSAVLKQEPVGRQDNFFALGGHSLSAIRLLGRVAKRFGVRLSLRDLFEHPTIAALAEVVSPPGPLEAPLAALWSDVLKRPSVGRDADFFALGGNSLLAIRVLGRVAKQFGVRLSLRMLFEAPTLKEFAELLDLELKLAAAEAMTRDAP